MLDNQITTKVYAGTAATATKKYAAKDTVVYRLDGGIASDHVELTVRYTRSAPKRYRNFNLIDGTGKNLLIARRRITITGVHKVQSQEFGWSDAKVNLSIDFDDYYGNVSEAYIKDLVANVVNIPLVGAVWTKLVAEES